MYELHDTHGRRQAIFAASWRNGQAFEKWLAARLTDDDARDRAAEAEEIAKDVQLKGPSASADLTRARRAVRNLNIATAVLTAAAFMPYAWFNSWFYILWFYTFAALPFAAGAVMKRYPGLVKINIDPASLYPQVDLAVLFPGLVLALRTPLIDVELADETSLLLPAVVLAAVTWALLRAVWMDTEAAGRALELELGLAGALIGCAAAYQINACGGRPKAAYELEVLRTYEHTTKFITSYNAEVGPWGPRTKRDTVKISETLYREAEAGEKIQIKTCSGFLGSEWICAIDLCGPACTAPPREPSST